MPDAPPRALPSSRLIQSLKAQSDAKRTIAERIADWATETFGSIGFLFANIAWFVVWMVVNTGLIPGIRPFDPFPFGLLTMIVSLEAIILAIFVLISQNRAEKVDDLREEVDLQVDLIAEEELTKLLKMVALLLEKHGIDTTGDQELQAMIQPTNIQKLEEILEKQILSKRTEANAVV